MAINAVRAACLALALCLLSSLPSPAAFPGIELDPGERDRIEKGEIVLREIPLPSREGRRFEAVARIDAAHLDVYRVLTDFSAYGEFMPNITSVTMVESSPGRAVVNYVLGLPLGRVKKYRLRLTFTSTEESSTIEWNMVDWPGLSPGETIEDTSGYWRLLPYPGSPGRTLALYHVYTHPGRVPFGLNWIVDILSRKSLPQTIAGTRARVAEMPR